MPKINTFDDVNRVLFEIAQQESFIAKKEADMNNKIQKIKDKFDEETKEARASKELLEKELSAFCLLNKSEFQKNRTKTLLFGKVGFRTTPPKVTQLNRKYTVATTIELLKKIFTGKFLRTKEEMDKEALLAAYACGELTDDKLAAVGLKVDQEDQFGYDIDWEKIDTEAA
ncbi:MAG: host-nuclease inhibitor Gam family protein [Bacteroidetes bacterium]|nr:host-nuclease inhibitor Gam family protein [Bacteroidota bacterium]